MRYSILVLGMAGAVLLSACGSSDPPEPQRAVGTSGMMAFTVQPEDALTQGTNTFHVRVSDPTSDAAMPGCTLVVTATMPGMGDGSDGESVEDLGAGNYEVDDVNFTMGGDWEVKFRCEMGTMIDEAAFRYDVP